MAVSWLVIQKPVRGDELLTNMEEQSRYVKTGSIVGCSDH